VSQPYNPRTVVEKTPNILLHRFLSPYEAFSDLDWKTLAENDAESILQRLPALDEADRRHLSIRFRQVHALANSRGTSILIAASGDQRPELATQLAARKNAYERAFWCLVEHPRLFDSEPVYAHTYSLPKTSRETRVGFPEAEVNVNDELLEELKRHIREIYKDEERAQLCRIDHRVHDGIHVLHAYPSDYLDEIDSYGSDGKLTSVSVTPPFHIVFYVDGSAGSVSLLAKGGSDKHDELFKRFSVATFGVPPPLRASKKTYDLSVFKDPKVEFKMEAAQQLRKLRVTAMRIHFHGKPRHRARFEVDLDDAHDDIYKVLSAKLRGGLGELAKSSILSVDLQAIFGGPRGKEEKIDFGISTKWWCTLGHEGREGILRQYLRIWKIESDGKDLGGVPEPVVVA